jgi:ribosome-binding ATPase YchF (GTP1/OBG family)
MTYPLLNHVLPTIKCTSSLPSYKLPPLQNPSPLLQVPAFLNVVDIAGLVKGASEGQGLGNAFLANIRDCDGVFHVTRAFEDEDITHVEGGFQDREDQWM